MRHKASRLTNDVIAKIQSVAGVSKICPPHAGWYRGRKILKVRNGTPGVVQVLVCEPEGQHSVHVYTTDCSAVIAAMRQFAHQNSIPLRE